MSGERPLALFLWHAVCVMLVLAGALFAFGQFTHHDVAYFVSAVGRMLDGARLYRDLIDVNVPTVYGVMMPAVWVARWFGLDPMLSFRIYVVVLAFLGAGLLWAAAHLSYGRSTVLPEMLAGAALMAFLLVPGPDFGQREHLAAIFLVPYAALRSVASDERGAVALRLAVGTTAGVAVALKPYFALPLAGIELACLFQDRFRLRRLWSVETGAVSVTVAAAAAATVTFFPDYLDRIVPLARATYSGFEVGPLLLLTMLIANGRDYLIALVIAVVLISRAAPASARLAASLCGGAVGALIAYWLQAKSWNYQLVPAQIFSLMAFWTALAGTVLRHLRPRVATTAALCGLSLLLFLIGSAQLGYAIDNDRLLRGRYAEILSALDKVPGRAPVLFISVLVEQTFPAVNYSGRPYPYRYHHLLPLPGLYRDFAAWPGRPALRRPAEMGPIERRFFEEFVSDAVDHPPAAVFVDRRPVWLSDLTWRRFSVEMDLLAYFCQSPRFSKLMSGYVHRGRISDYDEYVPIGPEMNAKSACDSGQRRHHPAFTTAQGG